MIGPHTEEFHRHLSDAMLSLANMAQEHPKDSKTIIELARLLTAIHDLSMRLREDAQPREIRNASAG